MNNFMRPSPCTYHCGCCGAPGHRRDYCSCVNKGALGKHVCLKFKFACGFYFRVWAQDARELRQRRWAEAATAEPELESDSECDEWIFLPVRIQSRNAAKLDPRRCESTVAELSVCVA